MAGRIRSIKPEILDDEKTAGLSHIAWRLFVSLWLIADDYGNLRGDPTYILGQTLWAAKETRETVATALDELAAVGLLTRYTVRGQGYCHITGWSKHQKVAHPGKPRMPGPDEADAESSPCVGDPHEGPQRTIGDPHETRMPDLRSPTTTEDLSLPRAIQQPVQEHQSPAGGEAGAGAPAYDPANPFSRGRFAEATWRRVSDARIAVAAELRLPAPLPFDAITPGSHPRGFVELSTRIREAGANAPAVCDRVLENAVKQARAKRSIDWLGERLFGDKAWLNARDGVDPSARSSLSQRAGPSPTQSRPRDRDPPPKPIPASERAGPLDLAGALNALGWMTRNDDDTDDEQQAGR